MTKIYTSRKVTIMKSKFNVGRLIWNFVGGLIIVNICFGIIGGLLFFTIFVPIIMAIFGLLNTLSWVISTIGYCMTYAELTADGIKGRSGFKSFEVSFDQITCVESVKKSLIINTNIPKKEGSNKMKLYRVNNIANSDEFKATYLATLNTAAAEETAE